MNQLCISDSGETLSMLAIICCCSLSMTAVCIGCNIGKSEKLPGLEGRAIYFDVYLHGRS